MKKLLLVMLSVMVMLSFAACGKSEAAQVTDDLIAAIGEVTLNSEAKIVAAEEALDSLSSDDKEQVENKATLIAARATYDELVQQEKEKELDQKAAEVEAVIAQIGAVTLDSEAAITAARNAYDALEEDAKAYVDNLKVLEDAATALSDMRVGNVEIYIDSIGTVTTESGEAIQVAQDALAALSAEDAAKVSNVAVLENAIVEFENLNRQMAEAMLGGMRLSEDFVRGLKFYYPMAFPYYTDYWGADVRCFVLPYLGMQGDDVWLRLVCNYTEDDWIFFEKITYAVDDKRYYDTFNYFDVTRDNDSGDVWEYVDIDVYDSDVEMLWAIANSNQTIIRFEGDNYYYDFTVSDQDKQAIREMLTVYEALSK